MSQKTAVIKVITKCEKYIARGVIDLSSSKKHHKQTTLRLIFFSKTQNMSTSIKNKF